MLQVFMSMQTVSTEIKWKIHSLYDNSVLFSRSHQVKDILNV